MIFFIKRKQDEKCSDRQDDIGDSVDRGVFLGLRLVFGVARLFIPYISIVI